jgi:hypothetical protein
MYRHFSFHGKHFFFFFFDMAHTQSFPPTNTKGAQAFSKEFPASAPQLIQKANPQSDDPNKQFALSEFQT